MTRIGILLLQHERFNEPAFKYLISHLNTVQSAFEYEFLPTDVDREFLTRLGSNQIVDRQEAKRLARRFAEDYKRDLIALSEKHNLKEAPPDHFIVVSLATFSDNFYSSRIRTDSGIEVSILSLGQWEREMAPPSLLEFILALILRESVATVSPSLSGSVHLGSKGCLFDFTRSLDEVRLKVLNAFVCTHCRSALENDKLPELAGAITTALARKWLGSPWETGSPASIISRLGYDLFTVKGAKATFWESLLSTVRQDGTKELIKVFGAIAVAALLLFLGLKATG